MSNELALLGVFAHPDDECGSAGGSLARYSAAGVHTVLVCMTDGQEATIVRPELDLPAVRARLGKVRAEELRGSARALGIGELRMLAYSDSGMAGWPQNERPNAFMNQDFEAVVRQMVGIMREVKPQVVITHNEGGGYGHPDHIMTHRVVAAAFDAAGDPAQYPEVGPGPFRPLKLYFGAQPRGRFERMAEIYRQLGRPNPFEQRQREIEQREKERQEREPNRPRFFTPDELITTRICIKDYLDNKRRSTASHKTQFGDNNLTLSAPDEMVEMAADFFYFEHFTRAKGPTNGVVPEDDLFSGIV